jgi:Flp pilus assembly protein TadG
MALRPTKNHSRSRGVLLVEAAIVLPLLLILSFLLLEYGWLFLKAEQVSNAARHGARKAIVADAKHEDVLKAISDLMTNAGLTDYPPPQISSLDVEKGAIITVTVSVNVINNPQVDVLGLSGAGGFFPVLPTQLSSSVSMAKERS